MAADDDKRVFVSHASEDKPFARQLARRLDALGWSAWIDERAISGGDDLRATILAGIERSRHLETAA